jgi:parvulin-like peptidyl-prolyl isomerase
LFGIPAVGGVYSVPVRDGQRYYILRMTGRTEARERSFSEAERSIRVRMVEQRIATAEKELLESLKKQYAVTIDEGALAQVKIPTDAARENLKDALR